MPKISEFRKKKTIELPSLKGAKVTVYTSLLVGETEEMLSGDQNDFQKGVSMLGKLIIDWNLCDDDDKKLNITLENIKKLPVNDVNHIVGELGEFFDPKKVLPNLQEQSQEKATVDEQ